MSRRAIVGICVLLSASVAALGQSHEENWDRCTSVDPDASIAGCTALIHDGQENDPNLSMIHYNLAASYQIKKQYAFALKNFDEAIRLNPRFAQALNGRGTAYLEAGDYDKAVRDFGAAVELNSNYSVAYFNRGRAYSRQGDLDHAIDDFSRDLKLVPNHAIALTERGKAYSLKAKDDLAIADFDSAVQLNSKDAETIFSLGKTYNKVGQYEKAIESFGRVIELRPKDPAGYLNRGLAYYEAGKYQLAIADFDRSNDLAPNNQAALFARGCANLLAEQLIAAVGDFEVSIAIEPKSAMAVYATLWLHLAMRRVQEDDTDQLTLESAQTDLSQWPGPMLKMDLEEVSDLDVLSAVTNTGTAGQKTRACEANFYTGEDASLHQLNARAIERLNAALNACAKDSIEYHASAKELQRLSADAR